CGLEVDEQVEFGRVLDRDVTRLCAAKDFVDQLSGAPKQLRDVCSVGDQASRFDVLTCHINRQQSCVHGQGADAISVAIHEGVANDVKCLGPVLAHGVEYGLNILS